MRKVIHSQGGLRGERDGEIGRRLEKGQPGDPVMQRKKAAQVSAKGKKSDNKDWELEKDKLEAEDVIESEGEIKQTRKYLEEVAAEERKREEEMRERVEEIQSSKFKVQNEDENGLGELVEPVTKKKEGFMTKLKKKGQSAVSESRGATVKGGG